MPEKNKETKECANNLSLFVRAETKESLELAMQLAFRFDNLKTVDAFCVHADYGMILFKSRPSNREGFDVKELPYRMGLDRVIDFVYGWLESLDTPESFDAFKKSEGGKHYGKGSDVWSHHGFEVYNEQWGHVARFSEAFVAVRPAYIWIGK